MVAGFINLLNVAFTILLYGTSTAPFNGSVAITKRSEPVAKLHVVSFLIAFPATSSTLLVMVAVYTLLGNKSSVGVKVAFTPR